MLTLGFALQETETYYAATDPTDPEAPWLALVSTASVDGGGLAAVGRF
jgi:hypothetical protein